MSAFRTAGVYVRETLAGTLRETDAGQYSGNYLADETAPAVSLTLPPELRERFATLRGEESV